MEETTERREECFVYVTVTVLWRRFGEFCTLFSVRVLESNRFSLDEELWYVHTRHYAHMQGNYY